MVLVGLDSRLGIAEPGRLKLGVKLADVLARRLGLRWGGSRDEDAEKAVIWLRPLLRLPLPPRPGAVSSRRFELRREDAKSGDTMLLLARLRMKDWRLTARGLSSAILSLRLTSRILSRLSAF